LGPAPGNAIADDKEGDTPKPAAADAERPAREGQPAAREEGRQRRDGDAREGEKKDRPRDADREGQRPDRPRPEAREGERPRGEDGPRPEAIMQHRQRLAEMARDVKARLEKLGPNQDGEARELKEKLERIMRELHEMPMPPPGARLDLEKVMQRVEELKRRIVELREAGKPDEAERVAREASELMQQIRGRERGPGGPPNPEAMQDVQRRIQHLQAAAENLRAAGLPDQAEQMMRLIEHVKAGAAEGGRPHGEGARSPEGPGRPGAERRPGIEIEIQRPGPADRGVQELRNEVQQMRREMQELREQIKRLLPRERGGENK
jgi:DNA repair exonuclease SbcCD ATPase subunit